MFGFLKFLKADPKAQLKKVMGEFDLPTFPTVVLETLEKIRDPGSDAGEVARVLSADPGLTVRVLKTVNSAAFSTSRKIENIRQAVSLMGMSPLETLVLSVSMGDVLKTAESPCYDFAQFWSAAVLRASLARCLADIVCPAARVECFTASLLQDMALPFLMMHKPDEYSGLMDEWRTGTEDLAVLERKIFDWDHAEVATWLCSEWDLPERLAMVIGKHHGSMDFEGAVPLPAQLVCCIRDNPENDGVDLFCAKVKEVVGLDDDATEELVTVSRQGADELVKLMVG